MEDVNFPQECENCEGFYYSGRDCSDMKEVGECELK